MSGSFVFFAAADCGASIITACPLQVSPASICIFSTRNIVADVLKIEDGKDRLPLVPRSAAAFLGFAERLARVAT